MSNSIAPGSSVDVNVKVTALTTNPNVPVTYKTIILKKNLVNGVNTLTQEMMNQTNTKYEIKYDYDLNDEEITIPEGCILYFAGGCLKNGYLSCNSTLIKGDKNIFDCINLLGSIKNSVLYVDWFKRELSYNDSTRINRITNNAISNNKTIIFSASVYYIVSPIILASKCSLISEGEGYGATTLLNIGDCNIIEFSHGSGSYNSFKGLLFDKKTNQSKGNCIYADRELDHLYIERCSFPFVAENYFAVKLDSYSNPINGNNAIMIRDNKFSCVGSCLYVENGGDNCSIRDNNFISTKGYGVYWNGISGTASVEINHNAIVGGGKMIEISNVMTLSLAGNQIEVSHAMTNTAVISIGKATFRNHIANIDISHNNINLKTGSLETPSIENAIEVSNVQGGIIANNCVHNAKNYVCGVSSYYSILVIDTVNSTVRGSEYPASIIDPNSKISVIDFYNHILDLKQLKIKYTVTASDIKQNGVISQKKNNQYRFVTYAENIGAFVDLNGYPVLRSGTSEVRLNSSLPNYLSYGIDMVGFCYFDTTLNKPLWWNGKKWVDATGIEV